MTDQDWRQFLRADPSGWLLQEDNPSVRYLTLSEVLDAPAGSHEVERARKAIAEWDLVRHIFALQAPQGYWGDNIDKPYGSQRTTAYFTLLADLGLERDEHVERAADYLFQHSQSVKDGGFSLQAKQRGAYCMTGYLVRSLLRFGYLDDSRLERAMDNLVRTANEAAALNCAQNDKRPCQWGMVKMLSAFAEVPESRRSPAVKAAVSRLADELLDYSFDLEGSEKRWLSFGFPYQYQSDLLEMLMVLAKLGHGRDPRFEHYAEVVLAMQDQQGRWTKRAGSRTIDAGRNGQPNKWITLNALRMLKEMSR